MSLIASLTMDEWNQHAERIQSEIAKLREDNDTIRAKLQEEHLAERSKLKDEYDEKYISELNKIKSNSNFVKTKSSKKY